MVVSSKGSIYVYDQKDDKIIHHFVPKNLRDGNDTFDRNIL